MRSWILLVLFFGCTERAKPTKQDTPKQAVAQTATSASSTQATPSAPATKAASATPQTTSTPSTSAVSDADSEEAAVLVSPAPGKQLIALPGASAPLKVFPLSGPYKSFEEFCEASLYDLKAWGKKKEETAFSEMSPPELEDVCPKTSEKQEDMTMGYTKEILKDEKFSSGPYLRIKALHHQDMIFYEFGRGSVELAIQTKDGWFGAQLLSYSPEWQGAGGAGSNSRTIKELSIVDVIPGGEKELVLVVNSYDDKGGRIGSDGFKSKDLLFICGLGSKGSPACYPAIRVSEKEETNLYDSDTEALKKKKLISWKLKEPYLKDGQLTLQPEEDSESIPKRIRDLFGAHTLAFP